MYKQVALIILCFLAFAFAKEKTLLLSEKLGEIIDLTEKEEYALFPDMANFVSARIFQEGKKHFIEFTIKDQLGQRTFRQQTSLKTINSTKQHVQMVELSRARKESSEAKEVEALYNLGLRYSARGRYDLSQTFFKEILTNYPSSSFAPSAENLYQTSLELGTQSKGFWLPGAVSNDEGRTELLLFGGYYGLWLGIATPIYFQAQSSQPYALGLLLGGPTSFLLTRTWTKTANVSDSRAGMIILGGHLGTWQGIGWSAVAKNDGYTTVGIGELAGLVGIGIATAATSNHEFTTAQAGLMNYSMYWGAWFGLVTANISTSNDILRDMLIGTDVALVATAALTKGLEMSKTRYRLVNLVGVLGTMMGFGIDLLIEVDDAKTGFAIAGAGSIAGLLLGSKMTNKTDASKYSFLGKNLGCLNPYFGLATNPAKQDELIPSLSFRVRL